MRTNGGDAPYIVGMPLDLMSNCWGVTEHFLGAAVERAKAMGDTEDEDSDSRSPMDEFELILTAEPARRGAARQQHRPQERNNNSLAELKPLPPFTNYTGQLTINGIQGNCYHTIAAAGGGGGGGGGGGSPAEPNNNSSDAADQNGLQYFDAVNVVSSSTMDLPLDSIKTEADDIGGLLHQLAGEDDQPFEDFAAVLGSAIADTTVGAQGGGGGAGGAGGGGAGAASANGVDGSSRDSWMDIENWFEPTQAEAKPMIGPEFGHAEHPHYAASPSPPPPHQPSVPISFPKPGVYQMPLLQSRLQNGPPKPELTAYTLVPCKQEVSYSLVSECPSPSSSTPYLAHSPPGHVVSTSDLIRYTPRPSPELQVSFPHTTTPSKKSKSRSRSKASPATSTVVYSEGLGKEKPVHRCTICNRGFLNKSNIKVHLRTHTGEKPFRCEVCGKAFRQKAHLIKHAQIHKRIGRE